MKDYLVTITVKNNVLLSAMKQNGFKTAASLSRASGVSQQLIGGYLNLKATPFGQLGFKESIIKLSKVLRILPEDLFPSQHIKKALNKNKTSIELSASAVENFLEQKNPEKLLELKEMKKQINLSLSRLGERDRGIIEYRFGLNGRKQKTLKECGKIYGVTRERIRGLEARGLRCLRDSKKNRDLRTCVGKN